MLVVGRSGSGKSTLLAGIAGVLGTDEDGDERGSLTVDGVPASAARGSCGLVLQDPDSQVMLARVGDDIAFGPENLAVPRDEIWRRVDEVKNAVGLGVLASHPTSELSGGEQQRLALAGVLAMRPRALVLDEPTANIDPAGARDIVAAVRRAVDAAGLTLVVVEHRVDLWAPVVDRVVVLGPHGIVHDGPTSQVLGEHGGELAASGVWLPGHPVEIVPRRTRDLERERAPGRTNDQSATPLLEARGLDIGWPGREPVQRDITLTVCSGRMLAIVGENGVGKSTLAATLAGLRRPLAGTVEATPSLADGLGSDVRAWRSRHLVSRIGSVFQQPEHQFVTRTVRDEIAIGLRAAGYGRTEADVRVDEVLGRFALDDLADSSPFELSGGQQRRLSVATVLATRPRLIVLDEPTFGQDRQTWLDLVRECDALLEEGCALIAVSHDERFVEALATDVLTLTHAQREQGQREQGQRNERADGGAGA